MLNSQEFLRITKLFYCPFSELQAANSLPAVEPSSGGNLQHAGRNIVLPGRRKTMYFMDTHLCYIYPGVANLLKMVEGAYRFLLGM